MKKISKKVPTQQANDEQVRASSGSVKETTNKAQSFSEIVDATPKDRERVVDFLRAFSILSVVVGHWLISYITQNSEGEIKGNNAIPFMEINGFHFGWLLTWLFQVMPIFFFVGGYANFVGVRSFRRRNLGYAAFLTSRIRRMLKPVITLLFIWIPVNFIIDLMNYRSEKFANLLSKIVTQPLWFIAVYILVTALAWPMYNLHLKYGAKFLIFSSAIPFLIDWLSIGLNIKVLGYFNIFVWIWVHQLGFAYADGTLMGSAVDKVKNLTQLWKKFTGLFVTIIGATGLFFCSGIQAFPEYKFLKNITHFLHIDHLPYPQSMVGLSSDKISNMNPPTVAIMFLTITQIGLVIVFRDRLQKFLQRPKPWKITVAVNSMILTIFCWHQSALALVTVVRLALNINEPIVGSGTWWATRALVLGCYMVVLSFIVPIFWKYERWRNDDLTGIYSRSVAISSTVIVFIGVSGLAIGGISDMFGSGHDIMGLFQMNSFLSITLTICGAGALGVLRNMNRVAQGDLNVKAIN